MYSESHAAIDTPPSWPNVLETQSSHEDRLSAYSDVQPSFNMYASPTEQFLKVKGLNEVVIFPLKEPLGFSDLRNQIKVRLNIPQTTQWKLYYLDKEEDRIFIMNDTELSFALQYTSMSSMAERNNVFTSNTNTKLCLYVLIQDVDHTASSLTMDTPLYSPLAEHSVEVTTANSLGGNERRWTKVTLVLASVTLFVGLAWYQIRRSPFFLALFLKK
jgi:PB1 domain